VLLHVALVLNAVVDCCAGAEASKRRCLCVVPCVLRRVSWHEILKTFFMRFL
jgi:hypothetical protein